MNKAIVVLVALFALSPIVLLADETNLRCIGEGKYNGEPFQVEDDLNVYLDKRSNGDVFYKTLGNKWIALIKEVNYYRHHTLREDVEDKVKEHFELDRTTLEMFWLRSGINTDNEEFVISYTGKCFIFKPEPKI